MEEMIDKFDLVVFGVRFAFKHLNMDRDDVQLDVEFESGLSHAKYSAAKNMLIFDKDWIETSDALDVLKYCFYVVYYIHHVDLSRQLDKEENDHWSSIPWISDHQIFITSEFMDQEINKIIVKAREFSEMMIVFFSDEINRSVGVVGRKR